MGARADALLACLGVHIDVPSVPIHGLSLRFPAGSQRVRAEQPIGRVVRRLDFDDALAGAARARGVRILERTRVTALEPSGAFTRVLTTRGEMTARVVVGADGVGSLVRRETGLNVPAPTAQVVEVVTEVTDHDLERDMLHFESMDRHVPGYAWDFPTLVDGRPMVCRGAYVLRAGARGADPSEVLAAHMRRRGLELGRVRQKRFAERGFVPNASFACPGTLLVGEAAGIDPITGEGIPQAISYGALAGRYLARRLAAGRLDFDDWPMMVRREFFGRDLAVRSRLATMFYGRQRPWLERCLVERPWFLRAGVEFFAGRRIPRALVALVALFGLRLWLGAKLSRSV
jgi:flavin-dependent dehydrogenase